MPNLVLILYLRACTLLVCIPFLIAGFPEAFNTRHSVKELLCYAGCCFSGVFIQFLLNRALQFGPPTKVTALFLSNMLFSASVGVFLLGEDASLFSILGSVVIGISVLTVVLQRSKKDQDQTSPDNEQEQVLLTDQETET